jgi:hypothetical protein
MPYGVYPLPKRHESIKSNRAGTNLAVRISTRVRRSGLDRWLAGGADPASDAGLELRAAQLRSAGERARIANALVEKLGDARRGEPVTLRTRPQRAAVRDAADEILGLALRLREDRPVGIAGVAKAAWLVDDRWSPMHRHDAGDLHDAIRSALSALDATAEPAGILQAQAA